MELLTKEEEKRFSKEREMLAIESSEETEEEYDVEFEETFQRTTRRPFQVDVVAIREQLDRRLAKRRKLIADSGEGRRPKSRIAETQVTGIRLSKTPTKPKKKVYHERVVSDSSDRSVAKTDAAISMTNEEKREEPTLWIEEGGPLAVQAKVPMGVAVEPSE